MDALEKHARVNPVVTSTGMPSYLSYCIHSTSKYMYTGLNLNDVASTHIESINSLQILLIECVLHDPMYASSSLDLLVYVISCEM
jgi:hypothetical protein